MTRSGSDRYGGTIRRTDLPGGLRLITEALPGVRSVSIGVWVGIGSRDEAGQLFGASHFLEHLLFKGTRRRGALEIAAEIEAVGGDTNAFTDKEYTAYYARVLDTDLALAVDVLCDMLTASQLRTGDVETERGVILEEIAMHDDDPSDVVHDVFAAALYGDHPLGRPVIGSTTSIAAMSRDQIAGFYRRRYVPANMVVAVAGNIAHDEVAKLVTDGFAARAAGSSGPARARRAGGEVPVRPATVSVHNRPTEQAHLVLGGRGLQRADERRFALGVLCQALGGGMSSRLFQEIREKRGLAYSVYAFHTEYADAGMFGVYAGCTPARAHEVLGLIRAELATAAADGLPDDEVARGKGMLKGSTVLGLEDTGSRMGRLAKGELLHSEPLSVDELLRRIDAVTPADVRSIASQLLAGPLSLGVIGPFGEHDFDDVRLGER